jgi:hypothetical protein
MFSVSVNFDSRGTQTLCFDDAPKRLRLDKSIILHKVLTQCPFVTNANKNKMNYFKSVSRVAPFGFVSL